MLSQENINNIKLQAPGAGLPKFELFMARLLVRWKSASTSRSQAASIFESEKIEILKLAKKIDPILGCKPVLIRRLKGMEDSSRSWSVYMTVDHLRIVNQEFTNLIVALVRGETPKYLVSTADVKPSPTANAESVVEFEKGCSSFQQIVCRIDDLNTSLTWPHPWFGEFNAEKWHFMAGFHMKLHRQQILSILSQLLRTESAK